MRLRLTRRDGEPITVNLDRAQQWERFVPTEEEDAGLNAVIWFGPEDATYVKETKEYIDEKVGVQ